MGAKLFYLFSLKNWYSFAPLIGSLEQVPWFHQIDIHRFEPTAIPRGLNTTKAPTIIAYSFSTPQLPQIAADVSLLQTKLKPDTLLIAGGPHPSGDPHQTLELGFDAVLVGEGEQSFIELLYAVKEEIPLDAADIPGLIWTVNGDYSGSKPAPPIDLDQYPSFSKTEHLYPPIEISRGCPYSCAYCQVPQLHPKMRHRSLDRILDIVHTYRDVFKRKGRQPTAIRFITPNALAFANSHPKKGFETIERLLKEISSLPKTQVYFTSFPSEVRPEYLTDDAAKIIKKYATNQEIIIGGQTGSDELLISIKRGHTTEAIVEAVDVALRYHLKPLVDIILGLPPETPEDQEHTIRLLDVLIAKGAIPRIHHFIPLAGTSYYTKLPAPVSLMHRKRIGKLMQTGKARGSFEHQRKIAYDVINFLRTWDNRLKGSTS